MHAGMRQAGRRQACRQAGRKAGRQAGRKEGRKQAGTKVYVRTATDPYFVPVRVLLVLPVLAISYITPSAGVKI